jgi:hypothetical protein
MQDIFVYVHIFKQIVFSENKLPESCFGRIVLDSVHLGGLFPAYDEGRHWKKYTNDMETNDVKFF